MMKRVKKNNDIRILILENGFLHYQVAEQLNISESKFSELLRWELSETEKTAIKEAIRKLLEKERDYYKDAN